MAPGKRRPRVAAILKMLKEPETAAELLDLDSTERFDFLDAVADAFKNPVFDRTWKPREKWRQKDPSETARAFLERVYLVLPYDQRPYTHELGNPQSGDPELYAATNMIIANNRRHGRSGDKGSLDAARSLADVFPMIGNRTGPKKKELPEAFDAILYVSKRRAQALARARELGGTKEKSAPARRRRK